MTSFICRIVTAFFMIVIGVGLYCLPIIYSSLCIASLLLIVLATEWPKIAKNRPAFWLLIPIYPVLPSIILIVLNQDPVYRPLLGLSLLVVAVHDSGSYFVGKLCGRHPIAPYISPGKTWEGFFGGLIMNMIAIMSLILYCHLPITLYLFIGGAISFSTIAFLGDLFESWLKRKAGIKDSGSLLPGHGGFLDRFDSLLFVATFLYLLKHYFVYYCVR